MIMILIIIMVIIKKNIGVAGHNNHNKIKSNYICSLGAVKFLFTTVINVFKQIGRAHV